MLAETTEPTNSETLREQSIETGSIFAMLLKQRGIKASQVETMNATDFSELLKMAQKRAKGEK